MPNLVIDPSLFEKQASSLEVDVHLQFPSGYRVKHIEDANGKSVIKNMAQENWKAAVKIMLKNSACQGFKREAIQSSLSREFKEYFHLTTSVLKYSAPSELAPFLNKLVNEVASICHLWHSALVGAMGPCKSEDKSAVVANVSALCSAAAAKFQNEKMSV